MWNKLIQTIMLNGSTKVLNCKEIRVYKWFLTSTRHKISLYIHKFVLSEFIITVHFCKVIGDFAIFEISLSLCSHLTSFTLMLFDSYLVNFTGVFHNQFINLWGKKYEEKKDINIFNICVNYLPKCLNLII